MHLLQAEAISALSGWTAFTIGQLVIVVIGITLWKTLPQYIEKRKAIKLAKIKADKEVRSQETNVLAEENNAMMHTFNNRFDYIEECLRNLAKENQELMVITKNQTSQMDSFSAQIYLCVIYSENISDLERMIAADLYFRLGRNGNCKNYVITDLIAKSKENVKLWRSVLNLHRAVPIPDPETYTQTIAYISSCIR